MSLALTLSLGLAAPSIPFAAFSSVSAAAVSTTIDNVTSVTAGSTVSIGGTTSASEVIIKVMNPDGTILFFDIVKASEGRYSASFTVPSDAAVNSNYQVIAGSGSDVATKSFAVIAPPYYPSPPVSTPDTPTNPADSSIIHFEASDIQIPSAGAATLDAKKASAVQATISLPASAVGTIGEKGLQIQLPSGVVTLPGGVLSALAKLAGSDSKANITLQYKRLSNEEAGASVVSAGQAGAGLAPQGEVLELVLGVQLQDGTVNKLSTFSEPVTISLELSAAANPRLSGIYFIGDQGTIEYIGGTLQGNTITAAVSHFSKYGVFSYTKNYADVPSTHWAADVIAELTAKHVVQGMTNTTFGPRADVSRAEFVTMIVRALGLNAKAASPFVDVKAGSWYADAAAAAYENGIVTGSGANKFEPSKLITREELAMIIARVYAKQSGQAGSGTAADLQSFKDASAISSWAKAAVQTVIHEKLMIGSNNSFAPGNHTTRAEAAQVLYNLLFEA